MSSIFKIEIKRAFHNRLFYLCLFIGFAMSIMHIIQEVIPMVKYSDKLISDGLSPHSAFNKWMGGGSSFWDGIYFMIFPLLCSIPYADSFHTDLKTGYVKNVLTRTSSKNYLLSKFIAVFLSAGVIVVLPLILNFFGAALFLPCITPIVSKGTYSIADYSLWADIFYTYPFVYLILYLIVIFIVAGVITTTALAFSYYIKYRYIVLLTPFLLYLFISFEAMFFSIDKINISMWIDPKQSQPLDLTVAVIEIGAILLATTLIYFGKGNKNEIY